MSLNCLQILPIALFDRDKMLQAWWRHVLHQLLAPFLRHHCKSQAICWKHCWRDCWGCLDRLKLLFLFVLLSVSARPIRWDFNIRWLKNITQIITLHNWWLLSTLSSSLYWLSLVLQWIIPWCKYRAHLSFQMIVCLLVHQHIQLMPLLSTRLK